MCFTGDSLVHVSHVRDRSTPLGIVVDVADACVEVSGCHRTESLFVNQFDRAIAICHRDILEQMLCCRTVTRFGGQCAGGICHGKLRNGHRCRQTGVKYGRLVRPSLQLANDYTNTISVNKSDCKSLITTAGNVQKFCLFLTNDRNKNRRVLTVEQAA